DGAAARALQEREHRRHLQLPDAVPEQEAGQRGVSYEELLPPPLTPARPMPWRAIAAVAVPAAALAGGVGLQRLLEGPTPPGDPIVRWLLWSSGAGLLAGAVAGLLLKK